MICVLCRKTPVCPPVCCDKCGRIVCEDCRKKQHVFELPKESPRTLDLCKFCLAERELST